MMLFTSAMRADIVFSENFDSSTAALGVTTAGQFTAINGTNVDIVGPGDGFGALCAAPESGNCVDMAGTNGNPEGDLELTTPLILAPGVYELSFDLIGSQRGVNSSTQVIFGSYNQIFNLASGDDTSGIVNTFVTVAGGSTQLQFINLVPDSDEGALLDNIQIASTPEPGSLVLLATGLLGAGGMLRRRFNA